ncbi:MAG: 50S ribosome-binding GTPase, partial [Planctomycetaceae bacterium]|nr:50S ribosome-binding GTPase [Planctomycetaceae bacterium]
SCLFNALVEHEAAIVSTIKGTTRDVLRATAACEGMTVEVIDTAGWEETPCELMRQADDQRHQHSTAADVLLYCIASDGDPDETELNEKLWSEFQSLGIPTILV